MNSKSSASNSLVKTDFDFGWKGEISPLIVMIGDAILQAGSSSVLDVGCASCRLAAYLRGKGWTGRYVGVDMTKYEEYDYPKGVEVIVGDVFEVVFPRVSTIVLSNILEHVDDPVTLLKKALSASERVIINVPQRNEELWRLGVVEYHQLDKSHKHCGFTHEEIEGIVEAAGGRLKSCKDHGEIRFAPFLNFFKKKSGRKIISSLLYRFPSLFATRVFFSEMLCEVEKR